MNDVAIIGAGRLGTALGRALRRSGARIRAVADRSPAIAAQGRRLIGQGRTFSDAVEAARRARVVFLSVPDEEISKAASRLARSSLDWRDRIVFHCSGLLDSSALNPLRRRGAAVASCHPVQSFPEKGLSPQRLRGVVFGLEGDRKALSWIKPRLARLGAGTIALRPRDKPLYHAACSIASNDLVALLDVAAEIMRGTGRTKSRGLAILFPLIEGTLRGVKKVGTERALTGPIVRGDIGTVEMHLAALRRFPAFLETYRTLGLRALDIAAVRGLPVPKLRSLRRRLAGK